MGGQAPQGEINWKFILSGGSADRKNTARLASVEFLPRWGKNYARSRGASPFVGKALLFRHSQKAARKYLAGGLCRKNASQAQLRLHAYENLPQLSAVISRKATGEDLLFAPAAAGKQRLCMKPRAGQKQYGTKQPAGVGARPFESIFYGSVLSILRASAANSGSIVRRLCDFSSPISS